MRNIERAKIALQDAYSEATVDAKSYVVNLSPYSGDYGNGSSVITCYGFNITLKDGRRVVCNEMYTDEFFSEMSIDSIRRFLEERCAVVPADAGTE